MKCIGDLLDLILQMGSFRSGFRVVLFENRFIRNMNSLSINFIVTNLDPYLVDFFESSIGCLQLLSF